MTYRQELPKAVGTAPAEDFCGEVSRDWYSVYPREFLKHELWLRLGPRHRCVFQALYLHANKDRRCWPSLKTIAEEAGVCESSARSSLQYLEQAGYIKIEPRFREGRQTSNLYTLLVWPMEASLWGHVEAIPEGCEEGQGGGVKFAPRTVSREQNPVKDNNIHQEMADASAELEPDVVLGISSQDEKTQGKEEKLGESAVVEAMMEMGVARKTAKRLVEGFGEDVVLSKIALLNESQGVRDRAAWLVSAVTGDYRPTNTGCTKRSR